MGYIVPDALGLYFWLWFSFRFFSFFIPHSLVSLRQSGLWMPCSLNHSDNLPVWTRSMVFRLGLSLHSFFLSLKHPDHGLVA